MRSREAVRTLNSDDISTGLAGWPIIQGLLKNPPKTTICAEIRRGEHLRVRGTLSRVEGGFMSPVFNPSCAKCSPTGLCQQALHDGVPGLLRKTYLSSRNGGPRVRRSCGGRQAPTLREIGLATLANNAKLWATRVCQALVLAVVLLGTTTLSAQPLELTVDQTREKALAFNRVYLAAQEELTKAGGEVRRARAGALPTIEATGGYLRSFIVPKTFFEADGETQEFQFGYKNSFSAGLTVRQSLFQGGKVFAAYSIAKDYLKYSQALADQSQADVIYNAEQLFYLALLQRSRLLVMEKALEASSYNLEVVEKQFSQGLVSEYDVLRARVEKNNLLPRILSGESEVRLSEKRLKSFLGIDLGKDIILREEVEDTSLAALPSLDEHFQIALAARPEMHQADYMVDIRRKAIRVAKGDYYPSAGVFMSYDWQAASDEMSLSKNVSRSWTAGLELTIPIFQGGARGGEVGISQADHRQALLAHDQMQDDIRLQVEESYDRLKQAKEALDIQGANIIEAETGLRIANLRYESGVGTLMEVLSAQVALTDARNAQAEAIFIFRQAKSQMKRASTL